MGYYKTDTTLWIVWVYGYTNCVGFPTTGYQHVQNDYVKSWAEMKKNVHHHGDRGALFLTVKKDETKQGEKKEIKNSFLGQ